MSYSLVGVPDRYEEALELCSEGLRLLRDLDDLAGVAQGLTIKGELARTYGDLDLAEEAYLASLELARTTGDRRRENLQHVNLGMVEQDRGSSRRAKAFLQEGVVFARDINFTQNLACLLAAMAGPLSSLGAPEKAATLLGASTALQKKLGIRLQASDQIAITRYDSQLREQLVAEDYENAQEDGQRMSLERAVAYALEDYEQTGTLYKQAT